MASRKQTSPYEFSSDYRRRFNKKETGRSRKHVNSKVSLLDSTNKVRLHKGTNSKSTPVLPRLEVRVAEVHATGDVHSRPPMSPYSENLLHSNTVTAGNHETSPLASVGSSKVSLQNEATDSGAGAVSQILERFLSDESYISVRRLLRANPRLRTQGLKAVINYGLEADPNILSDVSAHKRPPNTKTFHLSPLTRGGAPKPTSVEEEYAILEKVRHDFDSPRTTAASAGANIDSADLAAAGASLRARVGAADALNADQEEKTEEAKDNTEDVTLAGVMQILSPDFVDSSRVRSMTDTDVDQWNVSEYLKEALQKGTHLSLPMGTEQVSFTAPAHDSSTLSMGGHIPKLDADEHGIAGFAERMMGEIEPVPLLQVEFEPVQYPVISCVSSHLAVKQGPTDVVKDHRPSPSVAQRAAVLLHRFRPSEEDDLDKQSLDNAAALSEQRTSTVLLTLDGVQRLALWNRRLAGLKKDSDIAMPVLAQDEADAPPGSEAEAKTYAPEAPVKRQTSESKESKRNDRSSAASAEAQIKAQLSGTGSQSDGDLGDILLAALTQALQRQQQNGNNNSNNNMTALASLVGQPAQPPYVPPPVAFGQLPYGAPVPYGLPGLPYGGTVSPTSGVEAGVPAIYPLGAPPVGMHAPISPMASPRSVVASPRGSPSSPNGAAGPPASARRLPQTVSSGGQYLTPPGLVNTTVTAGGTVEVTPAMKKDLFTKCRNNRYHQVEEVFAMGVPVSSADLHGNQCLHLACQNGSKRMVKLCLRWGADINAQNNQGQTPLHYLFAYGYDTLGAYVITKGADDKVLNHFGYSCYDGLRPDDRDEAIRLLKENMGNSYDEEFLFFD